MISPELMTEVLRGTKKGYKSDGQVIAVNMNIHEFVYLCKEWMLNNGMLHYRLLSYSEDKRFISIEYKFKNYTIQDYGIHRSDRYKSLFNACQWILSNKGKQCKHL